jgi:hypothetical protein
MVEDRAVYGGLVLTRTGQATLVVANGGGHAVEAALVQLGQQAAGTALNTVDVAPTSPGDPNGLVEFYCVAFLGIGAAAGAMLLVRILGPVSHLRGALKRLGLMTVHTALLSAAITLFTDVVYGALAGHFWFLFLTLWLYVVAVCLAITGFAALAGPLASIVLIGLFIAFGNTSSGGPVPRPLLDGFFSALNPVLPQGAALSALRGVQYFGDRGIGTGLLCLTIWATAGLVLLGVAGLRLFTARMETKLVRPLMDALGLAPAGRVQVEAIAALVVGAGFMRHRMEAPGLRPLDAGQLTELLTPAVQALLDTAPRQA